MFGRIQEENCGSVSLSLRYDSELSLLTVRIVRAHELLPREGQCGMDPYCRLRLLPNRRHQLHSKVSILRYYALSLSSASGVLSSSTHHDFQKRCSLCQAVAVLSKHQTLINLQTKILAVVKKRAMPHKKPQKVHSFHFAHCR